MVDSDDKIFEPIWKIFVSIFDRVWVDHSLSNKIPKIGRMVSGILLEIFEISSPILISTSNFWISFLTKFKNLD